MAKTLLADGGLPAYRREVDKFKAQFPDVRHLEPAELQAMLARGPVTLLDCRSAEEHAVSTLAGALTPGELPSPLPADRPLVVFCTAGYRSSLEARRLAPLAGGGCYSMTGVLPWAWAGGELVDPATGRPTRRLHLFGARWAAMAPVDVQSVTFGRATFAFVRALLRVPLLWLRSAVSGGGGGPQREGG